MKIEYFPIPDPNELQEAVLKENQYTNSLRMFSNLSPK
jgi:hypothetical protein